jgi:surface antigen
LLQFLHRPVLYRTRFRIGLSAICPRTAAIAAILIGASLGGCSVGRNEGAFAKMEGGDVTGSVTPMAPAAGPEPTEADLAFARTAASDVLTKGGKDSSQPWENPSTGARGSVTPLANAYSEDGRTCRAFLASYVNGRSETWMQGAACRDGARWDVRSLKPWRRG